MIDGALPPLDVPLLGVPAPAPADTDAAAAELFATLVAQLLGQPAPTPAPVAVVADPKGAVAAAAPAPMTHAPVDAPTVDVADDRVHDGAPCAPERRIDTAAHTEPRSAHGPSADEAAPPADTPATRARQPVLRAPDVAEQRSPRAEPVDARRPAAPPRPEASPVEPAAEAPATPLLVVVPEPAPAPAPVVGAAAAAPATAPPELPVEAQVAAKVREVRLDEDGRHELTLDLHPAELGSVGVDVVVDGATVHVAIRAEHAPAADLLRSSLHELRQLLTDAGLDVGDLSSHDGARHQHHDGRPEHRTDRSEPVRDTFVRRATAADGVDVLL